MAHDRCSAAVEDLLDQEEDLEEALLEDLQKQQSVYDYDCDQSPASQYTYPDINGYSYSHPYSYPQERRVSAVDVAI